MLLFSQKLILITVYQVSVEEYSHAKCKMRCCAVLSGTVCPSKTLGGTIINSATLATEVPLNNVSKVFSNQQNFTHPLFFQAKEMIHSCVAVSTKRCLCFQLSERTVIIV